MTVFSTPEPEIKITMSTTHEYINTDDVNNVLQSRPGGKIDASWISIDFLSVSRRCSVNDGLNPLTSLNLLPSSNPHTPHHTPTSTPPPPTHNPYPTTNSSLTSVTKSHCPAAWHSETIAILLYTYYILSVIKLRREKREATTMSSFNYVIVWMTSSIML